MDPRRMSRSVRSMSGRVSELLDRCFGLIRASGCSFRYSDDMLLVVSLDGFRADYLRRGLTPHLQRLSECGVHAPYMRASFPTKTFPNHYTLVTVCCHSQSSPRPTVSMTCRACTRSRTASSTTRSTTCNGTSSLCEGPVRLTESGGVASQ